MYLKLSLIFSSILTHLLHAAFSPELRRLRPAPAVVVAQAAATLSPAVPASLAALPPAAAPCPTARRQPAAPLTIAVVVRRLVPAAPDAAVLRPKGSVGNQRGSAYENRPGGVGKARACS